jgi:hypothetical protein
LEASERVKKVLISNVKPNLRAELFETLSEQQILATYYLILQETRIRDYNQISDFLGDSEVIDMIKELISIFFSPLITLYQQADLSILIHSSFKFLKNVIDIAENINEKGIPNDTETARKASNVELYKKASDEFFAEFYEFLHKLTVADSLGDGIFRSLVNWLMTQILFFKKNSSPNVIDLRQLIEQNLNEKEKVTLMEELNKLEKYFKKRKEERRKKIAEMLKNSQWDPNNEKSSLLKDYVSDDDIEDVNFGDQFEEAEERENNIPPEVVVIPKLVNPFKALATTKILVNK